jgi:hypothetical protein
MEYLLGCDIFIGRANPMINTINPVQRMHTVFSGENGSPWRISLSAVCTRSMIKIRPTAIAICWHNLKNVLPVLQPVH